MNLLNQKYIYDSIKGRSKSANEDNILIVTERDYTLYSVFDGVGSAANSKKATVVVKKFIAKNYMRYIEEDVRLDLLMYEANIYLINLDIPETLTTYCIAYIPNDKNGQMYFSSMGDTRLYIISKQYIELLTKDDRVLGTKNILNKCLGMETVRKEDFKQTSIIKMDNQILICSDGFYFFLDLLKLKFFEVFNKKSFMNIKTSFKSLIKGDNHDDASYILII